MNWYKIAKLSKDDTEYLFDNGFEVIDEKNFDQYELYLIKATPLLAQERIQDNIPIYEIAIQRTDTSFLDMGQSMKRNPPQKSKLPIAEGMKWIKKTIEKWRQQYGPITVGGASEEKTNKYKTLLKRLNINFSVIIDDNEEVLII